MGVVDGQTLCHCTAVSDEYITFSTDLDQNDTIITQHARLSIIFDQYRR